MMSDVLEIGYSKSTNRIHAGSQVKKPQDMPTTRVLLVASLTSATFELANERTGNFPESAKYSAQLLGNFLRRITDV